MSTIRVVNIQHPDSVEPNVVLKTDGTAVFASGITISGSTNLTVSGTAEFASGTAANPGITFIDDNDTGIYSPAANEIAITTNGTQRLRVDNTGLVGIGTTNPLQKLSVLGTSNDTIDETTGTLRLQGSGGNGMLFGTEASSPFSSYIQSAFVNDTSIARYALSLNPIGGKVGIGTTSPSNTLQIGGSNSSAFGLGLASGNQAATIKFNTNGDLDLNNNLAKSLIFSTSNAARVTVNQDGNVGIGNSNPDAILTLGAFGGSTQLIRMRCGPAQVGGIDFGDDNDADAGRVRYHHLGDYLGFFTSSAQRIRVDSDGLKFGTDSAASNALDDYEEGYWEPGLTAVTPGTLSFTKGSANGGHYTKIGRTVYFSFNLQGTLSVGTATGNAFLNNLPFQNAAFSGQTTGGGSAFAGVIIPYPAGIDPSGTNYMLTGGLVQPNTTLIVFYKSNGPTEGFVQITEFAATINIHGSGSYTTFA